MVFWYACACSVLVGWVLSTGRSWDFMIQGNGFMISLVAGTVVQELLEVAILWRKSAYRTDRLIHKGRNPPNQSHLGQLLWFGSKWSFRHLQRPSISLSDDWHERVCFNLFHIWIKGDICYLWNCGQLLQQYSFWLQDFATLTDMWQSNSIHRALHADLNTSSRSVQNLSNDYLYYWTSIFSIQPV